MDEWFEAVKQARRSGERMTPIDEEPPAGWMRNELTEQLLGDG